MTFSTLGPALKAHGFDPIPILSHDKRPAIDRWQEPRDTAEIERMAANGKSDCGTGILTRTHAAGDIDCYNANASKAARRIMASTCGSHLVRVGEAPKAAILYRVDEPFTKITSSTWIDPLDAPHPVTGKALTNRIEFLGDGQQIVLDGVHPDTGKPYKCNQDLSTLRSDDLPLITRQMAQAVCDEFDQWAESAGFEKVSTSTSPALSGPVHDLDTIRRPIADLRLSELKQHLREIHPQAMDYDGWLMVGMALHHQFSGTEKGLKLWHSWAADGGRNPLYSNGIYGQDDYAAKYETFKEISDRRPVTAATLIKWSDEGRYRVERKPQPVASVGPDSGLQGPSKDRPKDKPQPTLDFHAMFDDMRMTDELLASIKDAEHAYPGLIIKAQITAIIGMANAGKSALVRHLCTHFASVESMSVAYFDLDSNDTMIQRNELHARAGGYRYYAPHMVRGGNAQTVIERVEAVLETGHRLDDLLIVLDTLKKFADMMSKAKLKAFFELLRELTAKGATVILLGHANKYRDKEGNLIFEGTGDVKNDADCLMYLESAKNEDGTRQVISTYPDKTRGRVVPMTFELDLDTFDVHQRDEFVDIKTEAATAFQAKQAIHKADPEQAIRTSIRDAVIDGFTLQKEIVAYCQDRGHPLHKVLRTLKLSSDPEKGVQWLEAVRVPGKDNRLEYRLLEG